MKEMPAQKLLMGTLPLKRANPTGKGKKADGTPKTRTVVLFV